MIVFAMKFLQEDILILFVWFSYVNKLVAACAFVYLLFVFVKCQTTLFCTPTSLFILLSLWYFCQLWTATGLIRSIYYFHSLQLYTLDCLQFTCISLSAKFHLRHLCPLVFRSFFKKYKLLFWFVRLGFHLCLHEDLFEWFHMG